MALIHIGRDGLRHAVARHTFNRFTKYAAKSKFNLGEDLIELIRLASREEPVVQPGGKLVYSADAGRTIGTLQHGGTTSIVTVVTSPDGTLITMFPGRP